MKELNDILTALAEAEEAGQRCALATVVKVDGSSYRRPGARMLIVEDGTTAGSVSGGCLEADVIRIGIECLRSGASTCLRYDTNDEDVVFGVGLGCNGVICIVVEPVDQTLTQILRSAAGREAVIAVRFGVEAPTGTIFALDTAGAATGRGKVDWRSTAEESLRQGRQAWRVLSEGGEAFFDYSPAPVPLVLFGAGHDAAPLADLAKKLGWHVTVIDHRPAYADPARFPRADAVIHAHPGGWESRVKLTDRSVAVVMSHSYAVDLDNFALLLDSPVRYIGLLGPKSRGARMLAELRDNGQIWDDDGLRRVHSPVGLDIGADTPELIALSILAEIQATLAGRPGGELRHRMAPIYSRL